MPKSCCVVSCTNNVNSRPDLQFYILPAKKAQRKLWLTAINRVRTDELGNPIKGTLWSPKSKHHYVCSEHFISGKRELASSHPDYVLSVFKVLICGKKVASPHRSMSRFNRRFKRLHKRPVIRKKLVTDLETEKAKTENISTTNENIENLDDIEDLNSPLELENMQSPESESTISLASPISVSEREELYREMDNLRAENRKLRANLPVDLSVASIRRNPGKCLMLTRLRFEVFETLLTYLCTESERKPTRLKAEDQILLTIIKLKHNMSFDMLCYIVNISHSTAVEYFWTWVDVMYKKLRGMIRMSDRDNIFKTIPSVFKVKFPRLTSIIDCFEIFVESPASLLARAQLYSQYKKHCTIKVLISCTPLGAINFISKCYGGRASDVQITRESGFHLSKYHMPSDPCRQRFYLER
ncbi:uncharacterized protein LOC130648034 [Hydractinia symbiolongicarpus]|uniref:uncharacterized protein LOC130648034 n=1 Tax=Hydractinia symbiolongicarpus TaxID=13093 RepID=UPI00254DD510|nr:uncharacterized protein LOC130648034 [Hydractinia symbiolongicarpus]